MELDAKINEFFAWLEMNTDYGDWDEAIKIEVESKLKEMLKN